MEKKEIEKIVKKHTMIHFPHIHPYAVMDFEQGLIEALNQALSMSGVVGRSEQLFCDCKERKTDGWYGDAYMCKCGKPYIEE